MDLAFGIHPLHMRIVISPEEVEETVRESGVILPPTTGRNRVVNTYKGEVIAVGDGVTKVEVGQLVLGTLGVGDLVDYDGDRYTIIDQSEVLAVLDRR